MEIVKSLQNGHKDYVYYKKTPRFDEKSMDVNFINAYISKGNQALDLSENVKRRFTKSQLSERKEQTSSTNGKSPVAGLGQNQFQFPKNKGKGKGKGKTTFQSKGKGKGKTKNSPQPKGNNKGKGKTKNKAWTSPKGKGKTKGKGTKGKGYGETKGAHKGKGGWTSPYWIGAYPGLWT